MHLVRYRQGRTGKPHIGTADNRGIRRLPDTASVSELLRLTVKELRERCRAIADSLPITDDVEILAPIDGRTEVWAAGVTYLWSRDARVEESRQFAAAYTLVYDAPRPELFFKSAAWRVSGDGQPIAIREDSDIDVPEPELAIVVNRHGEIAGYTVCNDVSSRSIEAANPLYLPQAKVYLGGCAVGPMIRPGWEIDDPYDLTITMEIFRAGELAWSGHAATNQLKRKFDELVDHLFRADDFPDGVVLSTGTCLVPDLPFTLRSGDRVRIDIGEVGTLENPVVQGKTELLRWHEEGRR